MILLTFFVLNYNQIQPSTLISQSCLLSFIHLKTIEKVLDCVRHKPVALFIKLFMKTTPIYENDTYL